MSQESIQDMLTSTQPSSTLRESATLYPDPTATVYFTDSNIFYILIILTGVTGIIGNSLVILAIILSRKLRSTLHWFVLNLACVDAFTSLMLISFAFVVFFFHYTHLYLFVGSCIFWFFVGVSVSTHALIAFTSWYLITKYLAQSKKLFSTRNTYFMVAFAWLSPFIPFFPVIILGFNENIYPVEIVIDIWILGHFLLIVTAYIKIWRFVAHQGMITKQTNLNIKNHKKIPMDTQSSDKSGADEEEISDDVLQVSQSLEQITGSECEPTAQPCPAEISSHACEYGNMGKGHGSKKKTDPKLITLTKNLFIVLFAFFICFIPFSIVHLCSPILPDNTRWWSAILLFFNSCINPIIYARRIREFREVMVCIIRCQLGNIPMPIECLRRMTNTD